MRSTEGVYVLTQGFLRPFFCAVLAMSFGGVVFGEVVTDELVQNLECSTLSVDSIYRSINPTAFAGYGVVASRRESYLKNSGADGIGQCWSLSRWQRLNLLLGRTSLDSRFSGPTSSPILKMMLGYEMRRLGPLAYTGSVQSYSVFARLDDALAGEPVSEQEMQRRQALIQDLEATEQRAIEDAQLKLFYRVSNLGLVLARQSQAELLNTLKLVKVLAGQKKLPMVVLRHARLDQHVVLVRSVTHVAKTEWKFEVIDPNNPMAVQQNLDITIKDGAFIVMYPYASNESENPVSVYLVGEEERPLIDQALIAYYGRLCR